MNVTQDFRYMLVKNCIVAYYEWKDVLMLISIHEKSASLFVRRNVNSICGAKGLNSVKESL